MAAVIVEVKTPEACGKPVIFGEPETGDRRPAGRFEAPKLVGLLAAVIV